MQTWKKTICINLLPFFMLHDILNVKNLFLVIQRVEVMLTNNNPHEGVRVNSEKKIIIAWFWNLEWTDNMFEYNDH